jgi:cytochrome c553
VTGAEPALGIVVGLESTVNEKLVALLSAYRHDAPGRGAVAPVGLGCVASVSHAFALSRSRLHEEAASTTATDAPSTCLVCHHISFAAVLGSSVPNFARLCHPLIVNAG